MTNISNINSDLSLENNNNIIFVDTGLDNYNSLISDNNQADIVLLDSTQDGITQITQTLANYQQLDSIQIFSHGQAGSLQLGSTNLSSSNLNSYSSQLAGWSESLTNHGDIMLFGCNLGASNLGLDLITRMSQLTDADIAASNDLTGSSQLGGDWNLEITIGVIEANIAISADAMLASITLY